MRLPGSAVVLLAIGLTTLSSTADSKCAFIRYQISGLVTDCDSKPLGGVQVTFFIEDEPDAWMPSGTALPTSDADGRFSGEFWFSMYSGPGLVYADRCTRRLRRFTVVASKEAFVTTRKNIGKAAIPKMDGDLRARIEIPVIRLYQIGRQCCG